MRSDWMNFVIEVAVSLGIVIGFVVFGLLTREFM